jgi:protein TonB
VALLSHTLIVAGITQLLPSREPVEKISFTLVKAGNDVSMGASSPSVSSPASSPETAIRSEKPADLEAFTIPPVTTTASPEKVDAVPEKVQTVTEKVQPVAPSDTSPKSGFPSAPNKTKEAEAETSSQRATSSVSAQPSKPSVATIPSESGRLTPKPADKETAEKTLRRSESDVEDPYVALLRGKISEELYENPFANLRDLDRVHVLWMELRLLKSGVVRRVDIIESSGNRKVDAAARRGALGASPYPEPPESARGNGYRFQVELKFRPNRDDSRS